VRAKGSATRPLYSGELARLTGISADTLRFYERRGLLPSAPRTASGYRLFPHEALDRVKLFVVRWPSVFQWPNFRRFFASWLPKN